MRIVLAPDSFKGSLDQFEVCNVMADAIKGCLPGAEVILFPLSDGGDGFAAVLKYHCGGESVLVEVNDPLGRPIKGEYLALPDGQVVIEVASACGLQHLKANELNPLKASSYGAGQLIAHALDSGHRRLILGLGGSATNDAGAGLLTALGYQFLDSGGCPITEGAEGLMALDRIDAQHRHAALQQAEITLASDVGNPLLGLNGASHMFGPQKGASESDVALLEQALTRFDVIATQVLGQSVADRPGAGAAGGIGAALLGFCSAGFCRGFELVVELAGFESMLISQQPALVITGEGRLDRQTLNGKLPMGVAALANKCHLPVTVVAGQIGLTEAEIRQLGFVMAEPLSTGQEPVDVVMSEASERLLAATQRVITSFIVTQ